MNTQQGKKSSRIEEISLFINVNSKQINKMNLKYNIRDKGHKTIFYIPKTSLRREFKLHKNINKRKSNHPRKKQQLNEIEANFIEIEDKDKQSVFMNDINTECSTEK